MSNIKISEMAEAESLNDNDLLTIVQGGINKKITKQNAIGNIIQAINNPTYTTSEGTNLSIDNTRVGKMKFEYYGDTEQETTSGKNLFDKDSAIGGWVSAYNGKVQEQYPETYCYTPYFAVTPNTTYTCNLYNQTGLGSGGICEYSTTSDTSFIQATAETQQIITITTSATTNYIRFTARQDSKDHVQFEKGAEATAYEPFTNGPTPNPSYPQEVKVVTGENIIDIVGKNLFNNDLPVNNSWINQQGQITTYTGCLIEKIKCIAGQDYTIKLDWQTSHETNNGCIIVFYDKDGNMLNRYPSATNSTSLTLTKTAPANSDYMYVGHFVAKPLNVQLEQGSTATPYEPYQSQSYELNLGKNLLMNNNTNIAVNGITFIKNQDGSVTINGTATADTHYYMGIGNGNLKQRIDKEKVYSISIGQNFPFTAFFRISDYNNSSLFKQCQNAYGTNTNKVENIAGSYFESGQISAQILIYNGQTANNFTIYPQLEASPVATSYSQPNKLLELCKIGEFQDYIYNNGGRWFKHKEIEKLILNEIASFSVIQIGTSDYYRFQVSLATARNDTTLGNTFTTFSNYFKPCTFNNRNTDYNNTVFQICNGLTTGLGVAFNTNVATTGADFKTWLNTHNVVAYYIAKEFTEEEIIDETTLNCLNNIKYGAKSYYGQTNIMITSEELQPTLKVQTLDKIGD